MDPEIRKSRNVFDWAKQATKELNGILENKQTWPECNIRIYKTSLSDLVLISLNCSNNESSAVDNDILFKIKQVIDLSGGIFETLVPSRN